MNQDEPRLPKVFGIGFHKTGTTSLGAALEELGWRVCPGFGFMADNIAKEVLPRATELTAQYDAFEDNPWPLLFKEMDALHPGSKFIATWRPPEKWYESVLHHFGEDVTPMRKWIYGDDAGSPLNHRDRYIARYEQHYRDIEAYFADRPGDLLWMRWDRGHGWNELCGFLGRDVPQKPFPRANAGAGESMPLLRSIKHSRLGRALRGAYQKHVSGYGLKMKGGDT